MRRFDLSHLPANERAQALPHLLRTWAPFERAGYRVAAQREGYLALAWDADRVEQTLRAAEWPVDVPLQCELEWQAPGDAGWRLLRGLEGVEAQRWSAQGLLDSRWWPAAPTTEQWQQFVRACAPTLADAMPAAPDRPPEVVAATWSGRPWAVFRAPQDLGASSRRLERRLLLPVSLALIAATAAQAHRAWTVHTQLQQAGAELDTLKRAVVPSQRARDQALERRAQAQALAAGLDAALPLDVLAHLDELLPRKGVVVRDLDLAGMRLRLDLEMAAGVSRSDVIAALQQSAWFADVGEAKDSTPKATVPIELRLKQARPPVVTIARAATAASAASAPAAPNRPLP